VYGDPQFFVREPAEKDHMRTETRSCAVRESAVGKGSAERQPVQKRTETRRGTRETGRRYSIYFYIVSKIS